MTAALLERPTKMTRVALPGKTTAVPFLQGRTLGALMTDLGAKISDGYVPVVGGLPATDDTVIPEDAAVTVATRPQNG